MSCSRAFLTTSWSSSMRPISSMSAVPSSPIPWPGSRKDAMPLSCGRSQDLRLGRIAHRLWSDHS